MMTLGTKLPVAAVSGLLVALISLFGPDETTVFGYVTQYGLSGALFAVAVLFPYLGKSHRYASAAILLLTSCISYWTAVRVASDWSSAWIFRPDEYAFAIASLTGTAIVAAGLRLATRHQWNQVTTIAMVPFAAINGVLFYVLWDSGTPAASVLAYVSWHTFTALQIHAVTRHSSPGTE